MRQLLSLHMFVAPVVAACACVNALTASSSKWLVRFYNCAMQTYGKYVVLMTLADTRWNSSQMLLATMLRMQSAFKVFFSKHGDEHDFPAACQVLDQSTFWRAIAAAEKVVRPLAFASFVMQKDKNRLGDVFMMLGGLYRGLVVDSALTDALEGRWLALEQPLYVLGAASDVQQSLILRKLLADQSNGDVFSIPALADAAHVYYKKHIGPDPEGQVIEEFSNWMWLSDEEVVMMPHKADSALFWKYQGQKHVSAMWPRLAAFLLGVVVQSASCERMFKTYKMQHTSARNRLELAKAAKIVQVKMGQERVAKAIAVEKAQQWSVTTNEVHLKASKNRVLAVTEFAKTLDAEAEPVPIVEGHDDEVTEWDHLERDPAVIIEMWARTIDETIEDDDGFVGGEVMGSVAHVLEEDGLEDDRRPYPTTNVRSFPQEVLRQLPASNPRTATVQLRVVFANNIPLE